MKNSSLQEKTPTSDANKAISRHNPWLMTSVVTKTHRQ
jgi:hypothetical protein